MSDLSGAQNRRNECKWFWLQSPSERAPRPDARGALSLAACLINPRQADTAEESERGEEKRSVKREREQERSEENEGARAGVGGRMVQ